MDIKKQINKLVICTTAICRSNLHNKCIPAINDKLLELKDINIYWIINIDNISAFSDETQEHTVNNFNEIISNKIKKHYICPKSPSHPEAINNITQLISDENLLTENTAIFWLEDDWFLNEQYFKTLMSFIKYINTNTIISLSSGCFGLQPSIMGSSIFSLLFKKLRTNIDAEIQINVNKKKYIKQDEIDMLYLKYDVCKEKWSQKKLDKILKYDSQKLIKNIFPVYVDNNNDPIDRSVDLFALINNNKYLLISVNVNLFTDIGREWIKNTNLIKWSKDDQSRNITYVAKNEE